MVKGNVWMGGWYVTEMRCATRARPSPRQNRVAKEGVLRGFLGLRRL